MSTGPRISPTVIAVCGTVIVIAAIGAYMYLEAMGRPTGQLLVWVAGVIAPLFAYIQTSRTRQEVAAVHEKVNGSFEHATAVKDAALARLDPGVAAEVLEATPRPEER